MLQPVVLIFRARTLLVLVCLVAALFAQPIAAAATVEVFEFGDFALYVPSNVSSVRGILLCLGGPDTRAFVTGGRFGAPIPELEASLHILGQELRKLATEKGLAILGTSRAALTNDPTSDKLIFDTIREAAAKTGHSELTRAPLFLYGISGGTPEASGFTARNPGSVGALLLKAPGVPERLSSPETLAVPTYIMLGSRDVSTENAKITAMFKLNRGAGALWALAMEPNVPHHMLTPSHRAITINWMRAIVELRLGSSVEHPLRTIKESFGWLGNSAIGVSSWSNFNGDRRSASWFPSQTTAEEWKAFQQGNNVQ